MSTRIRNAFLGIVSVAGLVLTGQAGAGIVTDFGVDTTVRHFVIDGTVSSITHTPRFFFGDNQPAPQTYALSGAFDASFSRYWWNYYLDGDVDGTQGTFVFEENWLTFSNPNLIWPDDGGGFVFPSFFIPFNGANFAGSDGACNFPSGPNMYCSGWTNGPTAWLTGTFENGQLTLHGSMPVDWFENFSYDIRATAIPEPGILSLVLGGLTGLFFTNRRRLRATGQRPEKLEHRPVFSLA